MHKILLKMKKRGIASTFLVYLVVALTGLVVMKAAVVDTTFASSEDILVDQVCKNSVKMHAVSHIKTVDKALTDIKCPTKYTTIKYKSEEKKQKALANELFSCWNKFWEGQYELFEEPKTYCSVCSVIEFKDNKPINDFTKYLMENEAPNNKGTYFEYLSSYSTEGAVKFEDLQKTAGLEAINQETIDTNKRYAVVFIYAKGVDAIKRLYETTIGNPGAFRSAVAGVGIVATGIGAATSSTVIGSVVGVPIMITGVAITVGAAVVDIITAKGVEPDWASMVVLREYKLEELSPLCDYLVE